MNTSNSRRLAIVALCMTFCSFPGFAQTRSFGSFEARQWSADPSGGFSVTGGNLSETFDFQNDLGLAEDDALEGRLVFRPSKSTMIRLGYLPELQLAGDNVVSRTITFFGQPFAINERVVTDFTMEQGRLGFAWQFSGPQDRFRIGPLVEAKGYRGDLILAAPDAAVPFREADNYEFAFGAAGLIAELQLSDRIELFAEATEVVTGDEGEVNETEYGIRVRVLPKLLLVAGSRKLEIDIQDDTDNFVFDLDGIFLGAHARF